MKYQFMEQQRRYHRVEKMARVLEVSRGGYYAWRKREARRRAQEDERLVEEIRYIQEHGARYRYGSPRVTKELRKRGYRVGHNRVARLMRANGLNARMRKKYRVTTMSEHKHEASENLVNREFRPEAVNRVWASDLTYIPTAEGWLYLCVIMDLYSRRIIGWSMSKSLRTLTVLEALWMAISRRGNPKGVVFHSDRGVQPEFKGSSQQRLLVRREYTHSVPPQGYANRESFEDDR